MTRRRRVAGAACAALILASGLAVHLLLPDTAATDIAGDILYTSLIYTLLVILSPRLHPLAVGAICAGWCVGIELFQLTGIPNTLAAAFAPAALVLGTVFDPRDLLIGIGVTAVLVAIDTAITRILRRDGPRSG